MRRPDYYVLDTLANDVETIEDILRMLNSTTELGWADEWGRPFNRSDIVASLARLVRGGFVRGYSTAGDDAHLSALPEGVLPANLGEAYFGMTDSGRIAHTTWASRESSTQDGASYDNGD